MDKRMIKILEMIISQPNSSVKSLASKFDITLGQLEYTLKKINDLLATHGYQLLSRTEGHLCCELNITQLNKIIELEKRSIIFSQRERQFMIMMMLVLQENLSLAHFAVDLNVSKNTILNDLKTIENTLREFELSLVYSRKNGYQINGSEIKIRYFIIKLIKNNNSIFELLEMYRGVFNLNLEVYQELKKSIEINLNILFNKTLDLEMQYVIPLVLKRVSLNNTLHESFIQDLSVLKSQHKFDILINIISLYYPKIKNSRAELYYIAIYIMSSNLTINNSSMVMNAKYYDAIKVTIELFEENAIVSLTDKEELYQKLYQHLIPAVYRIKYGIPIASDIPHEIRKKYKYIHSVVKKIIYPIEEVIGHKINEDELAYITIILLGAFSNKNKLVHDKFKAVVLCENGLSVSYLLINMLEELFPEIEFDNFMSTNEFESNVYVFDLVFSTVNIDTSKPLFIVSPILNNEEKKHLRNRVMYHITGNNPTGIKVDEIMNIVKEFTDSQDYELLEKKLERYLELKTISKNSVSIVLEESLEELLKEDKIYIQENSSTLEEAILEVASPLIIQKYIDESYVDRVIETYKNGDSYFVIAPKVALPHAAVSSDVNKLGMSMLILKKPIYFSNENLWVNILIMISPVDKKSHIRSISELHDIMLDTRKVEKIYNAKNAKKIMKIMFEN